MLLPINRIINFFQKIKWIILARLNADYFIYSDIKNKDEIKYKRSGYQDVEKFILRDNLLCSQIVLPQATALEIGCGNGRMTEFIAENFKKVYAADIAKPMINLAKTRLKHLDNVIFIVNDGCSLAIPDKEVDFVFSYIVFQHFPTKEMVQANLKEIKRILKKNGLAKLQFRGKPSYGGFLRKFKWYYGVYFNKKELLRIMSDLGFKVLSLKGEGGKELWLTIQKN